MRMCREPRFRFWLLEMVQFLLPHLFLLNSHRTQAFADILCLRTTIFPFFVIEIFFIKKKFYFLITVDIPCYFVLVSVG